MFACMSRIKRQSQEESKDTTQTEIPRCTMHVGHTGSSLEASLPLCQPVSQPISFRLHDDAFDGSGDVEDVDGDSDICNLYDSEWCMLAAPAAPNDDKAGLCMSAAGEPHYINKDFLAFTDVGHCSAEQDSLLGQLAFGSAEQFPERDESMPWVGDSSRHPKAQPVVVSFDAPFPESWGTSCARACLDESDRNLIECAAPRLVEFWIGMCQFIEFVWGEFELADLCRDDVPVFLDGGCFDLRLHVAHDLLSESFQEATSSSDLFEDVG